MSSLANIKTWMSDMQVTPGGLAAWGVQLVEDGEMEAAAVAFELALNAKPDEAVYAAALASVEHRLGHLVQAQAHYLAAIERGLEDVQVWTNLAEIFLDRLDLDAAGDALERAIICDPFGRHPAGMRARALLQKALMVLA